MAKKISGYPPHFRVKKTLLVAVHHRLRDLSHKPDCSIIISMLKHFYSWELTPIELSIPLGYAVFETI